MKFKTLIYVFAFSIVLFNCSNSSNDDLTPSTPDPDPPTEKVNYTDDVKPIITSKCTNCHGDPNTNGAPTSYVTYTQVKNDINKILSRINNVANPMPQGGLMEQSLRDKIQQWKNDGLLEN
jgi:uncharacterized membrane protein